MTDTVITTQTAIIRCLQILEMRSEKGYLPSMKLTQTKLTLDVGA